MSDLSEFEAHALKYGIQSWYERILDDLTSEQRDNLNAALAARHISHNAIAAVLRKWGHNVTAGQVGHHRRSVTWLT